MSMRIDSGVDQSIQNNGQFISSPGAQQEHDSALENGSLLLSDRSLAFRWVTRVLREPLLHFLILGALIFGLYFWINGAALKTASPGQIEITAGTIELLQNDWRRQWQKDPTPEELQQSIDAYIRDEIFYREALALEMNQNDLIIRRRLIQKMEFLAEDVAALQEPTDADLQTYLDAHSEQYTITPRLSFSQLYFSQELRGDQTDVDARKLLTTLQTNPSGMKQTEKMGDRSMLPKTFTLATTTELESLFGSAFATEMATVNQVGWQGLFHSAYGTHLVHVTGLVPGHPATLAEVRDQVRLDWLEDQRQQRAKAFYQQLRDRYTIKIDPKGVEPTTVPSASKPEVD